MTGVLIIDKPSGPTSHDVVMAVKKKLGVKKVGHLGTLDPLATGVLPLCIGDATKLARFLGGGEKEYLAIIKLGEETDTYDAAGKIVATGNVTTVTRELISSAVKSFKGKLKQAPPAFSAIKVQGTPLYKLARKGTLPEIRPRDVVIHEIKLVDIAIPFVTISVVCSKGTYIRSLAFDIGRKVGCGAHLFSLKRTKSGLFSLKQSIKTENLQELKKEILKYNIIPSEKLLTHIPVFEVDEATASRIADGIQQRIYASRSEKSPIQLDEMIRFENNGRTVAIARYKGDHEFKLEKVLLKKR